MHVRLPHKAGNVPVSAATITEKSFLKRAIRRQVPLFPFILFR
jgi:hypothetical protein